MATFPFFDVLNVTLASGGTATVTVSVPAGEVRTVYGLRIKSAGAFSITGIRDSRGRTYTNAAGGNRMPDEFFANVADGYNGLLEFRIPITLQGNIDFMLDLVDTSASSNALTIVTDTVRDDGS